MRIAVVIATTGRPAVAGAALSRLARQAPAPDDVLIVGARVDDLAPSPPLGRFIVAPQMGSAAQRNHGLDVLIGRADIVVFIDDDYVAAPGFIAGVARLFSEHADVVAASGHLIADGVNTGGYAFEEADALIDAYAPPAVFSLTEETGTYGCNMAFRIAAAPRLRFDVNLPLYGWLEDTDFSAQYARLGRVVRCTHFAGVHLGVRSGRTSGVRLGYSQIANAAYLVRKGTLAPRAALRLAASNVAANLSKALRPEPLVDRRGRLRGNLLALADLARGRVDPRRVLEL